MDVLQPWRYHWDHCGPWDVLGPLGTLGRKRFHGHHSVTIATILEMMKGDNAMVAQSGYSQFQVLFKKKTCLSLS